MMFPPLPDVILDPIVRLALQEDLGRAGDITTDATIDANSSLKAHIVARQPGRLSGIDAATYTLKLVDSSVDFKVTKTDGESLDPNGCVGVLVGKSRSILLAERVMLNFLGHLSGIATLTETYVKKVSHTTAKILCTRKTTPGLRAMEKRAVVCGGGTSHRYGLDDAILIKDNHIAACGSVTDALKRAKSYVGHLRKIEIEVDTLEQLEEALVSEPDVVMLDNMDTRTLAQAVALIDGRCISEASGGVNLNSVSAIAETGVDYISVGALTHSAKNLDLGLDIVAN